MNGNSHISRSAVLVTSSISLYRPFYFRNLIEIKELESYDEQEVEGEMGDQTANFRTMGPLGKLYNIVIHIRGSAGHTKEFKDLTGRMIPLNNRRRSVMAGPERHT